MPRRDPRLMGKAQLTVALVAPPLAQKGREICHIATLRHFPLQNTYL